MNSIPSRPVFPRAAACLMGLCLASAAQAQIYVRPPVFVAPQVVVPQIVVPQPYVAVAPQPVYAEPAPAMAYAPAPMDAFIVNAAPADIVYLNGDTYVWAVDEHGNRYRRFYGHGDRRAEMFHRREELHHVMERNGGRLPGHEGARGEARYEGPGGRAEAHAAAQHNMALAHAEQAHAGGPGAHPGAPAPAAHLAAPAPQAHPAAAAPVHAAEQHKK